MHPISLMRDRYLAADASGLQICTHAIGDEGISTILDLYSDVVKAHGEADRRFRIEHAQHMAAKDFERFAQLHVIAWSSPTTRSMTAALPNRTSATIEPAVPTRSHLPGPWRASWPRYGLGGCPA